jgi:hypothetical protein
MYIGLPIFVPLFYTEFCLQTLEILLQCTQIVCNNLVKISINMVFLADYSRVFFENCQFLAQLCYWGHICKRILVGFDLVLEIEGLR